MSKPAANNRMTNNYVQFRLLHMPCCNILLCWVNPRRPMYCSECGTRVFHHFPRDKWDATYAEAWLRVKDENKAYFDGPGIAMEHDLKQIIANYHSGEGE